MTLSVSVVVGAVVSHWAWWKLSAGSSCFGSGGIRKNRPAGANLSRLQGLAAPQRLSHQRGRQRRVQLLEANKPVAPLRQLVKHFNLRHFFFFIFLMIPVFSKRYSWSLFRPPVAACGVTLLVIFGLDAFLHTRVNIFQAVCDWLTLWFLVTLELLRVHYRRLLGD